MAAVGSRDGEFFHAEGHGRKRLVLHVRQIAPVVPPHQRRIQDRQEEQIVGAEKEGLVVPKAPAAYPAQ